MIMKKEQLYQSPVKFEADGHTYELDGRKLEGVTPIIAWLFPDTYQGIPQSILNAAAEYGSLVHEKCELADDMGIVDDPIVQAYVDLCEAKGVKMIASEYLVSDEAYIASSIDKLTENLDICDIKTTSKVHIPNVTLQTSIYAWLFERQNAGMQVRNLYCIWLPKPQYGQPELIQLQRVPSSICEQIVDLYVQKANPIQARALLTACGFDFNDGKVKADVPQGLQDLMSELVTVKKGLDELKAREDELKAAIYDAMKAEGAKSWSLDDIEFTIKKASERVTVDTKKLQSEYADVFEKCKKVTQVKESLTYKVL
jgi:hypothetical protein